MPIISLINHPQLDRSLDFDLYKRQLRPFTMEHIIEYFRLRKIPDDIIAEAAQDCLKDTQGIPLKVLTHVDALLELLNEASFG